MYIFVVKFSIIKNLIAHKCYFSAESYSIWQLLPIKDKLCPVSLHCTHVIAHWYNVHILGPNNPNSTKSYKIVQKLSPKHAARGVAQSPYPIYRHGKACLFKQPPWRAAGDPDLARGRSRVQAPGPAGALRTLFSPPSLPPSFGR